MSSPPPQRALITGGSSGIGRAVAELFARNGLEVGVLSENSLLNEETVRGIRSAGGKAFPIYLNLMESVQVEGAIRRLEGEHGPIDILVNNAGIGLQGDVSECGISDLRRLFEVNYFAAYTLSREALALMGERGHGHIINVGSASAKRALPGMAIYASSKAAMHAFSQALRVEGKAAGVRVTEILPMTVRTPFFQNAQNRSLHAYEYSSFSTTPEGVARKINRALRHPTPEVYTSTLSRVVLALDSLFPKPLDAILAARRRRP